LREWQNFWDSAGVPYDPKKTLDGSGLFGIRHVYLETVAPGQAFRPWNPKEMPLKVFIHDKVTGAWNKEPKELFVLKKAPLSVLRKVIEEEFKIPVHRQCIVKEDYGTSPGSILDGENEILSEDLRIVDGTKIWVEEREPQVGGEVLPFAFKDIIRAKNQIEIRYSLPDSEEYTQKIIVNKNITLKEYKDLIIPVIGLGIEEFKVVRGPKNYRHELKNEQDTLKEYGLIDGTRLCIRKGKPLRRGETPVKFVLFKPNADAQEMEKLFEMDIPESMLVSDIKVDVAKKMKEEKNLVVDPNHLRMREIISKSPGKVFIDKQTLKEVVRTYSTTILAVQDLGQVEPKIFHDQMVIFLQQWHPSTFTLGSKTEIVVHDQDDIDVFKADLSKRTGIKNVGLLRIPHWNSTSISSLEIPTQDWDRKEPWNSHTVELLHLSEGDVLLYRDNDEPLKQLTKEEEETIKKEDIKRKARMGTGAWGNKEKVLKIRTGDNE